MKHKEEGARISALMLLSALQFINLLSIAGLFKSGLGPRWVLYVAALLILILNSFRYNKLTYDVLHAKWKKRDVGDKERGIVNSKGYIGFTIAFFVIVIIMKHYSISLHPDWKV